MAMCYDAIPCWIMPSWRVSEQLPGSLGAFDLVVMDEASQSLAVPAAPTASAPVGQQGALPRPETVASATNAATVPGRN